MREYGIACEKIRYFIPRIEYIYIYILLNWKVIPITVYYRRVVYANRFIIGVVESKRIKIG